MVLPRRAIPGHIAMVDLRTVSVGGQFDPAQIHLLTLTDRP